MPAVRQIARADDSVVTDLSPSDVLCERYPDTPVVSFGGTRRGKVGNKTVYTDWVVVRGGRYMVLGKPVFIPEDMSVDMPWRHGGANSPIGTDVFVLLNSDAEIKVLEFKPQYIDNAVDAIDTGVVVAFSDNGSVASLQIYDPERVQIGEYYRVIGGMHTLCVGAGSITGEGHQMWQRPAGSVIPKSVWAINFRPTCPDPRAMVYVRETDVWVDIYNASGDIRNPETRYGGVRLRLYTQTEFTTGLGNVGKRLLSSDDFLFAAKGSPAGVTVSQNTSFGIWFGTRKTGTEPYYSYFVDDASDTTGGHSSTGYKRLLSDIGCEEMCGLQGQFLRIQPRSGTTRDDDNYEPRSMVWTAFGKNDLGEVVESQNSSGYKYFYNMSAECAGGGASNVPEECGPVSTNARVPNSPRRSYALMSYVDDVLTSERDITLAGGITLITGAGYEDYLSDYYTGSRGCSPCLHISVRHQELSSNILPNFLWFRNIWTEPIVFNFDDTEFSSDRAVLEFAKLSGTMSWTPYNGSTEAQRTFNPGDTICVRAPDDVLNKQFGKRFRPMTVGGSGDARWKAIRGGVEVGGNVMSVLKQGITEFPDETENYAFREMFGQCPSLKTAKNLVLPAKMSVSGCYHMMFGDFDSTFTHTAYLEDAPEIMATGFRSSTQTSVYEPCDYMFSFCTRLVNAPDLSLEAAMYYRMFNNCTSLVKPPRISSTYFRAEQCCYRMFFGCTSMSSVPVLRPVGHVGAQGMRQMFGTGSGSAATAIRFSTTQHGEYQYAWSLPVLESGSDGSQAFDAMLNGTTAVRGATYYFTEPPVE